MQCGTPGDNFARNAAQAKNIVYHTKDYNTCFFYHDGHQVVFTKGTMRRVATDLMPLRGHGVQPKYNSRIL